MVSLERPHPIIAQSWTFSSRTLIDNSSYQIVVSTSGDAAESSSEISNLAPKPTNRTEKQPVEAFQLPSVAQNLPEAGSNPDQPVPSSPSKPADPDPPSPSSYSMEFEEEDDHEDEVQVTFLRWIFKLSWRHKNILSIEPHLKTRPAS